MLALDTRRQPNHFSPAFQLQHPQPQPPQSHPQYLDTLSYYQSLNASDISSPSSSHHSIDSTTLNLPVKSSLGFLDTQNLVSSPPSEVTNPSQYMTEHYGFHSPTIRIEQSSPALGSQLPQSFTDSSPYTNWSDYSDEMAVSRSLHAAAFQRKRAAHQRAQSASSSMVSNPSASPFVQGSAPYGYTVNNATLAAKMGQNFTTQDQPSSAFSNHLPTPTQTPTHESFLTTGYPSAYSQGGDMTSVMAAHLAMHNNIETHSNPEDEIPGMSHSGRQSVSSMGQDPSTPRTIPENYDDGFKVPAHGENTLLPSSSSSSAASEIDTWLDEYLQFDDTTDQQMRFPKLDRTVSDAYNDALFGAAAVAANSQTSAPKTSSGHHLSPHRNMINEYLQAAQMARSQSPTSTASRGVSPFRPGSPYVQNAFGQMQRPFTAASVRQAQQARASQMELSQHVSQQQDEQPKTISPKDAVLEYNETEEDAKMPLFSEGEASAYGQQFGSQQNFSAGAQNMVNSLNASRAGGWSNELQHRPNRVATTNAASFNFSAPAMAGYSQTALPFGSHNNYRAHPVSTKHEDTPEFPAHLTSMDSSASEAPSIAAGNHHHHHHHHSESSKPVSSTADSGTYTCTYHGCNLRFETPQKLQKHKRESHRTPAAGTQITPGIGSGMTSAQLAARNSQAGPHKCERINPTTGKPCNAIFSRPYDLTRHEDTIHNARKQKVRCALCVEEKTFSRNDALTRHMRVVHPEVDFPGKHRRRGAHE